MLLKEADCVMGKSGKTQYLSNAKPRAHNVDVTFSPKAMRTAHNELAWPCE
jgi:hypothetical protein